MSLLLDVHKDRVELENEQSKAEVARRQRGEDLQRIEQILGGLTDISGKLKGQAGELKTQIDISRKSSDKIDQTQKDLKGSFDLTRIIAGDLGKQLTLSRSISGGLEGAAASLKETTQKTDAILRETTESLAYLDVMLAFEIDPTKFRDEQGAPIVSQDVLTAYGQQAKGEALSDSDASDALDQLRRRHALVRSSVLQSLSGGFTLKKGESDGAPRAGGRNSHVDFLTGTDRVANFLLAEKEDAMELLTSDDGNAGDDFGEGVVCIVTYRLAPNRLSGITKYKDLNGARWEIMLLLEPEVIQPLWALLDVGQTDLENFDGAIAVATQKATGKKGKRVIGSLAELFSPDFVAGFVTIPPDFFK
ncbi:MAG TPA: hypothetical protein VIP46_00470 [Pyrinomonadaceae bacterium]